MSMRFHPPNQLAITCSALLLLCGISCRTDGDPLPVRSTKTQTVSASSDPTLPARERMVDVQIEARGIADPKVLGAMRKVPRHRFVPPAISSSAYVDSPLPIGSDQTISQPYIVAYMTEAAEVSPNERVLEIGTGSGYQAAVLAEIAKEVYTIEIVPELAASAEAKLEELGYQNVHVKAGDGYAGWPEHAPFDAILVTAAPDHIPQPLVDQLAVGGVMVIPVGDRYQEMTVIRKTAAGVIEEKTIAVRFVPMTGEAQKKRD